MWCCLCFCVFRWLVLFVDLYLDFFVVDWYYVWVVVVDFVVD